MENRGLEALLPSSIVGNTADEGEGNTYGARKDAWCATDPIAARQREVRAPGENLWKIPPVHLQPTGAVRATSGMTKRYT